MKPSISVLVPTRKRVELLHKMLESLVTTADEPNRVEVLFRADVDDDETIAYLRNQQIVGWLDMLAGSPLIVGRRLNGYATLPVFINELARLSTADLLIVINDDVAFKTKGWDSKLLEVASRYPDGIFNIGVDTVMNNPNFVFPCQSRRQVEIFGFFYDPRLVYTDIWLRDVLIAFGRAVRADHVVIEHRWAGLGEDQLRAVHEIVQTSDYQELYGRCVHEGIQRIAATMLLGASL